MRFIILFVSCLLGMASVLPAADPIPAGLPVLPASQVKKGMKGYGLTVFEGTKIERFDV